MTPFFSLKHQFDCQSCFPRSHMILVSQFKSIVQKTLETEGDKVALTSLLGN